MVQHYNVTLQRQVGELLGPRGRLRRIARQNLPIFMEVNPTRPILRRRRPSVRGCSGVQPGASDLLGRAIVVRLAAGAARGCARGAASTCWRPTPSSHAVDDVSGLNIGGESRPMLPVTIGDQASIDAALAREKGDALFDARHRFVLSFGYELPRLPTATAATRLALGGWQVERHHPGADRLPVDGRSSRQRVAHVADQPART